MFGLFDFTLAPNQAFYATSVQIGGENSVRIVEIADDQIEIRKIFSQPGLKFRAAGKKRREPRVFYRADRVGIKPVLRQRDNVFIAENFDMRLRRSIAKRFQRRQSKNKIANRATANDQNPVQRSFLIRSEGERKNDCPVKDGSAMKEFPSAEIG